jgi:ribosomal protein S18 acetylase RimI-like enzyme
MHNPLRHRVTASPCLRVSLEANVTAWTPALGLLGAYYHDDPLGVQRSITPYPDGLYNTIAGAQLQPRAVDGAIDRVTADAQAYGVPIRWWVGPATRPADLGERLLARGFTLGSEDPGMAVDLEKLNEDVPVLEDFTIRRAEDEAGYRLWAEGMLRGYGVEEIEEGMLEPWGILLKAAGLERMQAYTGFLAGRPVTSSLLFLGGAAGIYMVSTLPEARRQGMGTRITLAPLLEARRLGYQVGVLIASPDGLPVYQKLGFEVVCTMRSYDWRGER